MNSILDILNALEATTKKLEKEAILKEVKESDWEYLFCLVCEATYNPQRDYYIKKFAMPEDYLGITTLEETIENVLPLLSSRSITGNKAKAFLESALKNLSEEDATVLQRIVKRDLRCGISSKTINKVWPNLIYEHPYMRCSSFSAKSLKNISFPCYSQLKADGLYCDIVVGTSSVKYMTRAGNVLPINIAEVDNKLLEVCTSSVLQGELLVKGENGEILPRSEGNGYINSGDVSPERLVFLLWDIIYLEEFQNKKNTHTYKQRWKRLTSCVAKIDSPSIQLIDSVLCSSVEDIVKHFKLVRELGYEGTVIKDLSGVWKDGTSKHQVKCKVVAECDLRIVGWEYGQGKYADVVGALHLESSDGLVQVKAGTGLSDEQRKDLVQVVDPVFETKLIDRLIENETISSVLFNDITTNELKPGYYSLFLPRISELLRLDKRTKSEADSYERIKEQVDSFTDALKLIGA